MKYRRKILLGGLLLLAGILVFLFYTNNRIILSLIKSEAAGYTVGCKDSEGAALGDSTKTGVVTFIFRQGNSEARYVVDERWFFRRPDVSAEACSMVSEGYAPPHSNAYVNFDFTCSRNSMNADESEFRVLCGEVSEDDLPDAREGATEFPDCFVRCESGANWCQIGDQYGRGKGFKFLDFREMVRHKENMANALVSFNRPSAEVRAIISPPDLKLLLKNYIRDSLVSAAPQNGMYGHGNPQNIQNCYYTNGCTKCNVMPLSQGHLDSCRDRKLDGYETDIDCGGRSIGLEVSSYSYATNLRIPPIYCDRCANNKKCLVNSDCESNVCGADKKCASGAQRNR